MGIVKIIFSFLLTTLVFFAIDLVWLGLIAKNLYRQYMGHLLSEKVNWTAAIVFYLIYLAGILLFVVYPSVAKHSALRAILLGGAFGLIAYAT